MAKQKDYGYKTPVRRNTNNISGHKVGGQYSGGDCKIINFKETSIQSNVTYEYRLTTNETVNLFDRDISIFAVGGYFKCDRPFKIEITIEGDTKIQHSFDFEADQFEKIGLALEIQNSKLIDLNEVIFTLRILTIGKIKLDYTNFNYGLIRTEYFQSNDVYVVFFNSKKIIF